MDFPQKITDALAQLRIARTDGDVGAIERAESGVVVALASLDDDCFDSDADALSILDDEATIHLSDDDSSLIITIDNEDWSTIDRDDQGSWDFSSSWQSLFAAYLVATKVVHLMKENLDTDANAWIMTLPVAILDRIATPQNEPKD